MVPQRGVLTQVNPTPHSWKTETLTDSPRSSCALLALTANPPGRPAKRLLTFPRSFLLFFRLDGSRQELVLSITECYRSNMLRQQGLAE